MTRSTGRHCNTPRLPDVDYLIGYDKNQDRNGVARALVQVSSVLFVAMDMTTRCDLFAHCLESLHPLVRQLGFG